MIGSTIVTSISQPSHPLRCIASMSSRYGYRFILIGDLKSPPDFHLQDCDYFSFEEQQKLPFSFASICPKGHYARKNIGYLEAIRSGVETIWETDDDNLPADGFEFSQSPHIVGDCLSLKGWVNVYNYFADSNIWPRGLPLAEINKVAPNLTESGEYFSPIQQGLADENPDVDAIYRLIGDLPFNFSPRKLPVVLNTGVWCPFNSQNTTWFSEAFPLLYLPSYCSFRMTDIWRSFVAQRLLWTIDSQLSFHSPNVYQDRNDHDLMLDFNDEIPGYLNNQKIKDLLEGAKLKDGKENLYDNLLICYNEFVRVGLVLEDELRLLNAWIEDLKIIGN